VRRRTYKGVSNLSAPVIGCEIVGTGGLDRHLHAHKIFLHGLVVHARIGPCDQTALATLEVDLEVAIDLSFAAYSDKLSDTANYSDLARAISDALTSSRHPSLGEAACAAAKAVLSTEQKVFEVSLTLRNPRVVLKELVDQIGVSVRMCRRLPFN
jgi:dihydroneopterin aldolase